MLPAELLHEWALHGTMMHGGRKVLLDITQRIDCAKSSAKYYTPTLQPRPAEGVKPPVHKIVFDAEALAKQSVDQLTMLRTVLVAMQQGDVLDPVLLGVEDDDESTDPARYEALLTADSDTAGRA